MTFGTGGNLPGRSGFAERLLEVIDFGRRTATYKLALLLALLDLCASQSDQNGTTPAVLYTRDVAAAVAARYWRQVADFTLADGTAVPVRQISASKATIVEAVHAFRADTNTSGATSVFVARQVLPSAYEDMIDIVERTVAEQPLPRLQMVGTAEVAYPFIYEIGWVPARSSGLPPCMPMGPVEPRYVYCPAPVTNWSAWPPGPPARGVALDPDGGHVQRGRQGGGQLAQASVRLQPGSATQALCQWMLEHPSGGPVLVVAPSPTRRIRLCGPPDQGLMEDQHTFTTAPTPSRTSSWPGRLQGHKKDIHRRSRRCAPSRCPLALTDPAGKRMVEYKTLRSFEAGSPGSGAPRQPSRRQEGDHPGGFTETEHIGTGKPREGVQMFLAFSGSRTSSTCSNRGQRTARGKTL